MSNAAPAGARFSTELHGLRGVAALLVVIYHAAKTVHAEDGLLPHVLTVLNGRGAVVLFFVLSGLVLATTLTREPLTVPACGRYLVRRLFRLLPLVAFAVVAGTAYGNLLAPATFPAAASDWLERFYRAETDVNAFLQALVGYETRPIPPLWSIYVELIGSALLPLMVIAGRTPARAAGVALGLVLLSALPLATRHGWHVYLINFHVGATVLLWGPAFARWAERRSAPVFWALTGGLVATFLLSRGLVGPVPLTDWRLNAVEVLAIAPVVALVFYVPHRFALLGRPAARFLGDVSYSLYLLHFIVMAAAFHALVWAAPALIAWPAAFALTLVAAVLAVSLPLSLLTFRLIETSGVRLGRSLTARRPRPATVRAPAPAGPREGVSDKRPPRRGGASGHTPVAETGYRP